MPKNIMGQARLSNSCRPYLRARGRAIAPVRQTSQAATAIPAYSESHAVRNIHPAGIHGALVEVANQPLELRMIGTEASMHTAYERARKPTRAATCLPRVGIRHAAFGADSPSVSAGTVQHPQRSVLGQTG